MFYTIKDGILYQAYDEEALKGYSNDIKPLPVDYEVCKYIIENGELVLDVDWENKQAQKEKERIAMLSLTRGDVFRGLLMAKGVTRAQLRAMIETNEQLTEVEKEMALIDFDEALNFYRGNALIDTVGLALGITSEQLDKFFETKDYKYLLGVETFGANSYS